MKKALHTLSIISLICCSFCFVMISMPAIIGYNEALGFAVILVGFLSTYLSAILWSGYTFYKTNKPAIKIIMALSVILNVTLLLNLFLNFIPFGDIQLAIQSLIPVVLNIAFLLYSKFSVHS